MFAGTCIYLLTSNPTISNYLVSKLEFQYPQIPLSKTPISDAIIVLGGSMRPPSFPRRYSQLSSTSDRFWHAARLYKAGKAKKIILIGGNVYENPAIKPESLYVRDSLIKLGVPAKAIISETKSRTTIENSLYAKQLLEKHSVKSLLLVTSALHMPRAVKAFENINATVTPCSTDTIVAFNQKPDVFHWIPNADAFANSTKALHEYYGIWVHQGQRSAKNLLDDLKKPAQQTASL